MSRADYWYKIIADQLAEFGIEKRHFYLELHTPHCVAYFVELINQHYENQTAAKLLIRTLPLPIADEINQYIRLQFVPICTCRLPNAIYGLRKIAVQFK